MTVKLGKTIETFIKEPVRTVSASDLEGGGVFIPAIVIERVDGKKRTFKYKNRPSRDEVYQWLINNCELKGRI